MAKKMSVILMSDVRGLGVAGQTVTVARGYAMNYLLGYGFAMIDSVGNRLRIDSVVKTHAKKVATEVADIQAILSQVDGKHIQLSASVHGEDELYGSVGVSEIVAALREQHQVAIERSVVQLPSPIRVLGDFDVPLSFHHGLSGTIRLSITKSESNKKKTTANAS
ncbi:50S ribosomal protein L9 [bacterium]|nr:50S ribosomal protein L9 [bacterium]